MDFLKTDSVATSDVADSNTAPQTTLSDIHLALVGGGVGEVVFG